MNSKLVSVVMPIYNTARFLDKAIESVLSQTYTNFELLLIDDCSTDNSLEIANAYAKRDSRIRVIAQEKNKGVAHARNRGIEEAKGAYIALLDSDDEWISIKLERQVSLLEEHAADIAYCSLDFIDENGLPIKKPFIVPESTDYKEMLFRCFFSCSTVMITSELLKKHQFSTEYYHEDYVLWLQLLGNSAKAVGVPDVLAHYRQFPGSRSNNKLSASKERWKIYREMLGMNVFVSSITFAKYAIWGVLKYYT